MARKGRPPKQVVLPTFELTEDQLRYASVEAKKKYHELKEKELELKIREMLPHRYGWKWYTWAKQFYNSRSKNLYLSAGNQLSKSSTQIRKVIEWATNKELWLELWDRTPNQFWYFYPSKELITSEVHEKWIPEFLPRGELVDSERFGWKIDYRFGEVNAIVFNSGVTVYFKSYMQDPSTLQAGSIYYIAADEEMPSHLYDELNARRRATNGYLSMVFTATLGEDLWYRCMEKIGQEDEAFPQAEKIHASLLDCKFYDDGSKSFWTDERIQEAISSCKSEQEVLRRIHGRCVIDSNRIVMTFGRHKNVVKPYKIPSDWYWYAGIDYGSGGEEGHPSAIVFVAVQPDYKKGAVVTGWRGRRGEVTTMQDVVNKFASMWYTIPDLMGKTMNMVSYDYAAKDLQAYAANMGIIFTNADKAREPSYRLLNVLFQHQMLEIFNVIELEPLCKELDMVTESKSNKKTKAEDDMFDALRYCVMPVFWNFDGKQIVKPDGTISKIEEKKPIFNRLTRFGHVNEPRVEDMILSEIQEWNDLYE